MIDGATDLLGRLTGPSPEDYLRMAAGCTTLSYGRPTEDKDAGSASMTFAAHHLNL
jgi:uncharacterized OsmC-like protein